MQRNVGVIVADDCRASNRRNLLQSEVVSFFTPVADKLRLKDGPFIHKPRLDIVEETKPRTKTVVVRMSSPGISESLKALGRLHGFSLGELETNQIDIINNVSVPTTPQPTQTLSACLPVYSPVISNGSTAHQELDANIYHEGMDTKRPSVSGDSYTPNRKSLFANLIRRLSTPRNKISRTDNSVMLTKGEAVMLRSGSGSNHSSPRKLRRWLTKRIWKSTKISDPLHTAQYGAHSQPSLASADPILETHYTHSVVDDLSEALQSVTQDFGSAPVPRKRTILPYQVKSTPLYSQDICCQSSNHEIGAQEVTNEDKIDISSKVGLNDIKLNTEVKTSPNYSPSSLFCHMDASKNEYAGLHCPIASSPLPSVKVRGNSIRSFDDGIHRFALPLHHNIEANNIHRSETLISQCCRKLPHSLASQCPASPLAVCNYTPSYLNASLAAFGYSKYYSASKSVHNLTCRETCCFKVQPSTDLNKISAPSHDGDSNINNETATSALPNLRTMLSDELQTEKRKRGSPGPVLTDFRSSYRHTNSGYKDVLDGDTENVKLRRKRTTSHTHNTDDQEHWNRSSLIMLAVAHASPRGRVVTPTTGLTKPFIPSLSDSISADEEKYKSKTEAITTMQHEIEIADIHYSNIPFESSSTVTNCASEIQSTNTDHISSEPLHRLSIKIDGNFYLKQVDETEKELLNKVSEIDTDLNNEVDLNDEVSGLLRTASGKAKLLISEKFCQFRGLCHQNLAWENSKAQDGKNFVNESNTLVTLVSDLDGFWAMVSLQVDDVRSLFRQVDSLRANNWQPVARNFTEDASILIEKRKSNRKITKSIVAKRNDVVARQRARERLELAKRNVQSKNLNSSHDKLTLDVVESKLIFV
ncbi:Disks large-associated protein 5 [Schistosoma japonicum]|nr:Disks large-associated protein 5 [Schistosoma japonicum]KAH8854493.1 Disks large-associated protein 5 [Schistosoma japonicum]KAH8854494.1 Disks large-associated protein 5 [Schistosoma japonicum]